MIPSRLSLNQQSEQLNRGMELREVVVLGISAIVGTRFVAAAAHAGPGSFSLFLLAGLFFVGPMAQSVGVLATRQPGAEGQYVWARNDFGTWHGFLSFWLYWIGIASWAPSAALAYVSVALYAIDPALVENRALILTVGAGALWLGVGINLLGVKVGSWNQTLGSFAVWATTALLVCAAAIVYSRKGSATVLTITPTAHLDTLNFWSQIAFSVTGIELLGMMSEEIRDPGRTIRRAGWIAGLVGVLIYGIATLAILVIQKPEVTNVMFGVVQAGRVASQSLGLDWMPAALGVLAMMCLMGQMGGILSSVSRLSFAASRDGLLPPIFARVHPSWKTPHVSMLVLAGVSTALLLLMQLGDSMKAAYQELTSMMVLTSFVPILYIFASAWKAGLRWAPASGFLVTLVGLAFCILPTEDIPNLWLYEFKIIGGSVALTALGRWIFLKNHR